MPAANDKDEKVQILAIRVNNLRGQKKISFRALEYMTGIDRSYLCNICKKDGDRKVSSAGAIAKALDTTISHLAGEIDDPRPAEEINRSLKANRRRSAA